jgi:phosphocarrier protein HPr
MPQIAVAVASSVGLHARPASTFSRAAAAQPAEVTIALAGGEPVDAASVLSVMSLGAGHGDIVTLEADGPGAQESLEALAALLATDLDA